MSEIFDLLSVQHRIEQSAFKSGYDRGKGIEKTKVRGWAKALERALKGDKDKTDDENVVALYIDVKHIIDEIKEEI